jgi:glycosyltransferase involved in cell wall biosynthesis
MPRVIAHFTGSDAFGGAEQVLLTTLTGLDRTRWTSVLLYHPHPGLAPLLERARNENVSLRPVARFRNGPVLKQLAHFIGALRAERPAIFHAHLCLPQYSRVAITAAALSGVQAVVATEHLFPEAPLDGTGLLQRFIRNRVDRYIAVSDDIARRLRKDLRIPKPKIRVIRNGISLRPLDVQAPPPSGPPIVLTCARLHEQKGLGHLLEAAAQVPDAVFVIAGDGPRRQELEAQAGALRIADRVRFLGHRTDIAALLASCDLFVLPSLFEGLPLSVLEAMAAARPVVATAVGGTPEAVVPGHTGLLVAPADAAALADAIRSIIGNPGLAARLGANGRQRVERMFSADRMVEEIESLYAELLSDRRPE